MISMAIFVPYPHTTRTIVLCHGVTVSLINSVKYMKLFQKLGWNVMLYDHRRHGMSGGKPQVMDIMKKKI